MLFSIITLEIVISCFLKHFLSYMPIIAVLLIDYPWRKYTTKRKRLELELGEMGLEGEPEDTEHTKAGPELKAFEIKEQFWGEIVTPRTSVTA